MKKVPALLIVLMVVNSACQKSQFSTTTRMYKYGKVIFVNNFRSEWSKLLPGKSSKGGIKIPGKPANNSKLLQNPSLAEHDTINPATITGNNTFIASTSDEPVIIAEDENRLGPAVEHVLPYNNTYTVDSGHSNPDSNINSAAKKVSHNVHYAKIKFKNGHEDVVKILYQSRDTLKYKSVSEEGITRTVLMEKVDKILPDPRKTEKLGLAGFILSFLGLVPILGIPFAILAWVFGARSLRKIREYPELYKGKGKAKAAYIIGMVEVCCYLVLAIVGIIAAFVAIGSSVNHCTGG
jgi:hypothetical protein